MSPVVKTLFLAIYGILCLKPGVDALLCRLSSFSSWTVFLEPEVCEADPNTETCHATKVYRDGNIKMETLSCKTKENARCGTKKNSPFPDEWAEFLCCDDNDFCNENL